MTTTQVVLWCICGIGTVLACLAVFLLWTTKGSTKKYTWALLSTGQMLVAPYATVNLISESGILWKITFVAVLLVGLIAVFKLASYTKEK